MVSTSDFESGSLGSIPSESAFQCSRTPTSAGSGSLRLAGPQTRLCFSPATSMTSSSVWRPASFYRRDHTSCAKGSLTPP
eukprot:XP_001707784.1 Hypothetical protein GL50803_31420 [Giardia lamblia ATCC 50803]